MTRASDTAKLIGAGATILDGTTISTADNTAQLELVSTDADSGIGPHQVFYRNSSSPADADLLCELDFRGRNDNSQDVNYATVNVKANDVTDGEEDGEYILQVMTAGSVDTTMHIKPAEIVFNEDSIDRDFRVESNGNANMLFVDGGNDRVGINTGSPASGYMLHVGGSSGVHTKVKIEATTATGQAELDLSADPAGVSYLNLGDENSYNIGYLGYFHSDNSMRFQTNSAERMRIDSSGNLLVGATSSNAGAFGAVSPQILVAGTIPQVALHETDTDKDGYIGIASSTMFIQTADAIPIRFGTSDAERMRIDSSGRLLFGTSATTLTDESGFTVQLGGASNTIGLTTVSQLGGVPFIANRNSDDGTVIQIRQANATEGSISVSGSTTSYNAFSASHWSRLADNSKPTILKGTIIETIDEMCDWYRVKFTVAKTEEKEEYSEQVSIELPSGKKEGDIISYTHEGITYDDAVIVKEDDNKHTKCKISDTADSKKVYGVHADWDNDDDTVNDMYVTAVGTHVVRINKDVIVSAGDLLSSNGDGTAKVQDDDIIRSKTIGKVLTNIVQETYDDGSYTVPCALYCG